MSLGLHFTVLLRRHLPLTSSFWPQASAKSDACALPWSSWPWQPCQPQLGLRQRVKVLQQEQHRWQELPLQVPSLLPSFPPPTWLLLVLQIQVRPLAVTPLLMFPQQLVLLQLCFPRLQLRRQQPQALHSILHLLLRRPLSLLQLLPLQHLQEPQLQVEQDL